MDSIAILLLLQIVLIGLNAVFASAEIAVLSINESKLEKMAKEGNSKAKKLFKLTREPAKFLATIQVAITLSGFLGSAFAADNFSEPLVDWILTMGVNIQRETLDALAVIVITLILSYFTLVFGELVPKRLAMKKSESIAMGISGLLFGVAVIFKPIVWFLSASTNIILSLFGIDPNETEDEVSEEDIIMMIDAGSEQGSIESEEKELIKNIFKFNDITAREIVRHRTKASILWCDDNMATWNSMIIEKRYTLYPVCEGTVDNIIGILNAKDYFALSNRSRDNVLKNAVHPAYFVPDTIKADDLFRDMKKTHNSMALVIDEHGGLVGIITLWDLVESLVGEFDQSNN